jgi:hypothetical protein
MKKSILLWLILFFVLVAPINSEAGLLVGANIYPNMQAGERLALNQLMREAVAYSRPHITSANLPVLQTLVNGVFSRKGFAILGNVATVATLGMAAKDVYDFAQGDVTLKQYFDGLVDAKPPISGTLALNSLYILATGQQIKITTANLLPANSTIGNPQAGEYSGTTRVDGSYIFRFVSQPSAQYPNQVCVQKYGFINDYSNIPPPNAATISEENFKSKWDLNNSSPEPKPFPNMQAGLDAAMDKINSADPAKVTVSPSPSDVKDLAMRVQNQAAYDSQVAAATAHNAAVSAAATAAVSTKAAAQTRRDNAAAAAAADPADAAKADELRRAEAALVEAERVRLSTATDSAALERAKADADAAAAREAEAAAAAAASIPSNTYDPLVEVPATKAIPELLGTFGASSPLVAMVGSFGITTNTHVKSVSCGTVYGREIVFDFVRYEPTFQTLGGVLLVIMHGFAVLVVVKGW